MKKKLDIGTYEGDLWVCVNEEGIAISILQEEPSLKEMQGMVGGLIEYAPVKQGAVAPIPVNAGHAKLASVVSVICDEEGLLKNKTPNTIGTYAAYQEPFNAETRTPLVGPVIMHLRLHPDDEVITFEQMLRLVSGDETVREGFWLHDIKHFTEAEMMGGSA